MVFQLRPQDSREAKYPNAQDVNFLGYDRPSDRWKVDASGIHLYASGISVDLDHSEDSVEVWQSNQSNLRTSVYQGSTPWEVDTVSPTSKILVKKRFFYNAAGDVDEIRVAETATPSGNSCMVKYLTYNPAGEVDYIVEDLGVW